MATMITGSMVAALRWFAGETGSFGDELDRAPEVALVIALRDTGLVRRELGSYVPTPKGEALLASLKIVDVLVVIREPGTIFGGGKVRVEQRKMTRDGSFYRESQDHCSLDANVQRDGNLWHGAPDWTMVDAWAQRPEGATSIEFAAD